MASTRRSRIAFTAGATLALFWCSTTVIQAEVYRWVDANGNVHFSDQPAPGAEPVVVPPTTTITLPKLSPDAGESEQPAPETAPYATVQITFPTPNSAFHSGNGSFTVTTQTEPALSAAHELRLILDGQVYASGQSGQFALDNIDRGTHSMQLQVIQSGNVIQSSPETVFTIHRPSLLHPNRAKKP